VEWAGDCAEGRPVAPRGDDGEALRSPRLHRHLKGPRVLYSDDGTTPTNKVNRVWMEKGQRRALPLANGGFHILRHTFCSHLAMQGATAKAIQELAGHRDLTTAQRYMHLSPAHKEAAIRLLDRRPAEEAGETLGDGLERTPSGGTKPSEVVSLDGGGAGNRIEPAAYPDLP